jgi:hypothetical protein
MAKQTIMTVTSLKKLLNEYGNEITDDFQIWLSSDEEGNNFLPMFENPKFCLAIDPEQKRIILYPSHQTYF